jgi:predicted aldo/keto reductase-like oxidoreductase
MEYRKLPRGGENERFSVLGLGTGGINKSPDAEIEATVRKAIENGINYFDLCAGGRNVFAPFGRGMAGRRGDVFLQMHLGAVYNDKGDYGWSRDLETIKKTLAFEFDALGTDYADMGFLHCVDDFEDIDDLRNNGVLDYLKYLKKTGVVHHIGFSSHTPAVAGKIIDTGLADMMMFSINPAYDFECGDEYGRGTLDERSQLFRRCAAQGVGISVMKAFHGGQLLSAETSPFGRALTEFQCISYALDRPGVLTVLPGVRGLDDLDRLLGFADAPAAQKDYSAVGSFTADKLGGRCVYCGHCRPCPAGIDIGLVNKYYDLARAGDKMAAGHYEKLATNAGACIGCGHCDRRCPFGVAQSARMKEIAEYFK